MKLKRLKTFKNPALRLTLSLCFVLILSATQFSKAAVARPAQDTVSTEGLDFKPVEEPVSPVKKADSPAAEKKTDTAKASVKEVTKAVAKEQAKQSLLAIFLAGFAAGFAALLMPCIYPMIPLTVSFFMKSGGSKKEGIKKAIIYGLSIILIYVGFGLLISAIFGGDALNDLATNGVFNFLFFLLLVVFAASFLGAFEINMPSSWINKMDSESDRGGMAGLFFMAATLALVSFSCTGPLIGGLISEAYRTGALMGPAIGMFGFSLAIAIPFVLFAMFPSWLNSLPKSGGWLNSVKVVLGFLELAFALKFLSNVDLAYHWKWFDREVFLVLWIVIFALMGLYLLGKLKFSHDSDVPYISVPRLFLAIIVLSFTIYMVPGLWGAPLKSISAFLPPLATQDFDLSANQNIQTGVSNASDDTAPHKYADLFDKPKGFNPYFDYDEGLAYARKVNKPIMIDFTGHACVNCREMEASVWTDKAVFSTINQDYVLIQLYVDDKTDLEPAEVVTTPEGRKLTTIGKKWSWFQTSKFQANSQPFYVLLDSKTEEMLVPPKGSENIETYLAFLKSGLQVYRKK